MKIHFSVVALVVASTLSACSSGSSGSSSPSNSTVAPKPDKFAGMVSMVRKLDNGSNLEPVSAASLPDNAKMNGYLSVEVDGTNLAMVGDASATANFASGSLSGSAKNFSGYEMSSACNASLVGCTGTNLGALDGTLKISGTIDENQFKYGAAGRLSDNSGTMVVNIDDGVGAFGKVDGKLTAVGIHDGSATLTSAGQTADTDVTGILILQR